MDPTPVLAGLSATMAFADLVFNRLVLRCLSGSLDHQALIVLSRWGGFPRNLAAIAGLVALSFGLFDFLRLRHGNPLYRRVVVAGFAGIFLPSVALATVLPPDRTTVLIVVFGAGAANVLAVLIGGTAIRFPAPPGIRTSVALVSLAAFLGLGALVASVLSRLLGLALATLLATMLRHIGEAAYLAAPLVVLPTLLAYASREKSRVWVVGAGLATALAVVASMTVGWASLRSDFDLILYAAEGLAMLGGTFPALYPALLSVGLGTAVGCLATRSPALRQAGTGLVLVLSGGYAPQAPGQLLMMVLGVTLISRSCTALGQRS